MTTPMLPLTCAALAILLLGFVVLSRYLPVWAALLIAAVKAAIPFVYFGYYFQHSGWTLYDDLKYYDVAAGCCIWATVRGTWCLTPRVVICWPVRRRAVTRCTICGT